MISKGSLAFGLVVGLLVFAVIVGVLKMLKIIAFGMHFSNNIVIILKYAFLLKSLL